MTKVRGTEFWSPSGTAPKALTRVPLIGGGWGSIERDERPNEAVELNAAELDDARDCHECGRPFRARRRDARYCGATCRKRAERART